ncbi:hypothetical protein F7725_022260 [Dissostichus mawsoni]|uniref:Uncharacterized protein n=1 Tax=Dissostichus mawsoni TaxID=36200 RepID=A0A7J5YXG2_DISMA|nr:hypothetical protein F7725_022260 [Dissostichus mawsoni]
MLYKSAQDAARAMRQRGWQKRDEEQVQHAEANSLALTMRSGLEAISKEIRNLKTEMKKDLTTLKEQVTEDVKSEINDLKREMYQQLSANTKTLQAQGSRIAEAEGRIAETETWNMEVKDALCKSLKQQQMLQDKLTDIEGRSRRNNIRIFGIPRIKKEILLPNIYTNCSQRSSHCLRMSSCKSNERTGRLPKNRTSTRHRAL